MRLEIHARNVEMTPEVSRLVERAVLSALTPFGSRVGLVSVLIDRPRVGGALRCHILASVPPGGAVSSGEIAQDLPTAVDRAARRAAEAVKQELGRGRGRRGAKTERPLRKSMDPSRGAGRSS